MDLPVSNGLPITSNYPSALAFTTGSNSTGYTLQSVTLKLKLSITGSQITTVDLYSISSGDPDASLATMTTATVTLDRFTDHVFNCSSGCQLSANTSYFIVLSGGRKNLFWAQDSSGNQTNTPSDAGWTIADDAKYQNDKSNPSSG